ncbi:protein of unknown function DUF881 [Xylanimonas cellulosilytica DSM 15894]|uniref:Membrane associated protein n=1 Tax=Xylanimonas cellulosilytica (strain DSM 15894 / JCM 12276 / CECT 5975 / KCTC 9989 / LMG 20990 / NBRC 107835 / XIL07) TaxID=446471 RepID=D1BSR6_XYLCX|nr:DUF881 domain-containing protein [Xylanimonas cellulosilytica]ACZ30758.1 protein of unknown function DUF881 [Xylanimonas cellulosilytica DSM 15894]
MTSPSGKPPRPPRRLDESMTLLTEVMERPLDPGYAEATARRREAAAAGTLRRRSPATSVGVVVLAVALGLVTAVASHQLRVPQASVTEARTVLERQITERGDQVAGLTQRADDLSREIVELQRSALETQEPGLLDLIQRDSMHNGTEAVSGPGLVVSLTDAGGGLVGEPDEQSLVRDQDLQVVVNELWAAGAEAVSVDDQRLTAKTAIRNAGAAVLVNLVPLPGPTYVVRAVGDPEAMQTAIARSSLPGYLQLLGGRYGIRSSVVAQSSLDLPGAGAQPLQHAQPVGSRP